MSKQIEISDETYEKIKDQLGGEDIKEIDVFEDLIGEKYFIRTVTYHIVGKIVKQVGHFFVLKNASWVADSGRFTQAIKDGELDEVEPTGDTLININSVVDMFPWKHKLPTNQS